MRPAMVAIEINLLGLRIDDMNRLLFARQPPRPVRGPGRNGAAFQVLSERLVYAQHGNGSNLLPFVPIEDARRRPRKSVLRWQAWSERRVSSSPDELLMTLSTSAVAVCCCNDLLKSRCAGATR